jgi:hypothetical protein
MSFAPVALFAYNRLEHLTETLNSLSQNNLAINTDVCIYLDGPKNDSDRECQSAILIYLNTGIRKKFNSFTVKHSSVNRGLAESIIAGVTETTNIFGKVIVIEDDLVTSKYFLTYMNEALNRYESDERVISIHGYVCPINPNIEEPFFLKGADCWGWATWSRGWKLFESDGSKLLKQIQDQNLEREFNFENTYNYVGMLKDQIDGRNNSWAIRWLASAFLKQKLTLYPGRSLVVNIGMDGSGTHCDTTSEYNVQISEKMKWKFPDKIEPSMEGYKAYVRFFKSTKISLLARFKNKIKKMIK